MKFPWKRPASVYESDGPQDVRILEFGIGDVLLRIECTDVLAPHTGRNRFKCTCVTCNEVLHEATTGPTIRFEQHLNEAHGRTAESETSPITHLHTYSFSCPGCGKFFNIEATDEKSAKEKLESVLTEHWFWCNQIICDYPECERPACIKYQERPEISVHWGIPSYFCKEHEPGGR